MILFILILLVTTIAQVFLPWWSIVPVSFVCALFFAKSGKQSFLAGFFAVGISWFVYSFFIHWKTEGLLTQKISEMMSLPSLWILFVLTSLIGGITGGTSAWAGYIFKPKKRNLQRSPYF